MEPPGDERTLEESFWDFRTNEEWDVVDRMLRRRFPDLFLMLSECLESADPMDIVYPDNPNEYSDVVKEMLVILAGFGRELTHASNDEIFRVVKLALARCFGELAEPGRAEVAAELISAKLRND